MKKTLVIHGILAIVLSLLATLPTPILAYISPPPARPTPPVLYVKPEHERHSSGHSNTGHPRSGGVAVGSWLGVWEVDNR